MKEAKVTLKAEILKQPFFIFIGYPAGDNTRRGRCKG
jgi:hypothetical protein